MLVDRPSKFVVELVGNITQYQADHSDEYGHRDSDWFHNSPEVLIDVSRMISVLSAEFSLNMAVILKGISYLIILHSSFNKETEIIYTEPNNLDSVF